MQECFLPHYNERQTPVDMLVLHATCHADAHEVFESLDKLELSCHYFVDLNGRITRMVDEQNVPGMPEPAIGKGLTRI